MVKKITIYSRLKKVRKKIKSSRVVKITLITFGISALFLLFIAISFLFLYLFNKKYEGKIFPGTLVEGIDFGNKKPEAVKEYFLSKNIPFEELELEFIFQDQTATLSGAQLDLGFDATLSAQQAYLIGRGGDSFFTNLAQKFDAYRKKINLKPLFRYKEDVLDSFLNQQAQYIDIPHKEALFTFKNGRVTAFQPSSEGRRLDKEKTKVQFTTSLTELAAMISLPENIKIELVIETIYPSITTNKSNTFGINERIGSGVSYFQGSIQGRVHNIALAASRLNGVLIPPNTTFSFNATVGDISAATGYKQAYIIKDGRTVLDDGGGVCQVSTTLFRAALNAGLSIKERHPHSYRVSYYEQGGWKPGFDATVFSPSYDLKFTNNTGSHILIQAHTDTANKSLVFELFGTSDGRTAQITNIRSWDYQAPPPALYQEDPTLAPGQIKQVDWAAAGIKAAFDYKVIKDGKEIENKTFFSNFIPWQAVFLTGPAG